VKVQLLAALLFMSSCSGLMNKNRTVYPGWSMESLTSEDKVVWSKVRSFDSQKGAVAYIEKRNRGIEHLIKPRLDPYTGELLGLMKCRPQELPKKDARDDNDLFASTLYFYSSGVNALGQCFSEESLVRTNFTSLYCKGSRTLYVIKHFYDKDKSWFRESRFRCD